MQVDWNYINGERSMLPEENDTLAACNIAVDAPDVAITITRGETRDGYYFVASALRLWQVAESAEAAEEALVRHINSSLRWTAYRRDQPTFREF